MTQEILIISDVKKNYGKKKALEGISFTVKAGEQVALLGCNGAGKSTLLNIITKQIAPSSGSAEFKNKSLDDKDIFSYLPQTLEFPKFLKLKEVLDVVQSHYSKLPTDILDQLDISKLLNKYCHQISGGEQRKLGFALSLIGKKDLLILDEPTANIDLVSKQNIYKILSSELQDSRRGLLFSSHEMNEVESLADKVIVLHKGRLIEEGSVWDIKKKYAPLKVSFESSENIKEFVTPFKMDRNENTYTLYGEDSDEIVKEVINENFKFKNLKIEESKLDEVFVKLWGEK